MDSVTVCDEGGQHGHVEQPGFRIEQIGDQPAREEACAIDGCFGVAGRRVRFAPPTFPGEPQEIERARPSQRLIEEGRTGDQRGQAKRGAEADDE
jgi:hypothetical protein